LLTPENFLLTFENHWDNLKPDLGRFYDTDVPKRKVLGCLVFQGILPLTIVKKKDFIYLPQWSVKDQSHSREVRDFVPFPSL
jgi:hypothetical protein